MIKYDQSKSSDHDSITIIFMIHCSYCDHHKVQFIIVIRVVKYDQSKSSDHDSITIIVMIIARTVIIIIIMMMVALAVIAINKIND